MELLLANVVYVGFRFAVSGPIVKFLLRYFTFYLSVFIMAQISFVYDTFIFGYYFNAQEIPGLLEFIQADILYTLRVLAAWWLIKVIWDAINNYWIALFIGAEITFVFDYFIFEHLFS